MNVWAYENTETQYQLAKMNCAFNKYIEYKSKGDQNTSIKQYFQKARPYFCEMMYKFRKSSKSTIQSTMNVNFISSEGNDGKQFIYSKSDKTEVIILFSQFLLDMEWV